MLRCFKLQVGFSMKKSSKKTLKKLKLMSDLKMKKITSRNSKS